MPSLLLADSDADGDAINTGSAASPFTDTASVDLVGFRRFAAKGKKAWV